jgi:predicted Zn-dependent protease with MMP-like domain
VDPLPRYQFDRLVADVFDEAMDDMPAHLHAVLDNVAVRVEDRHPDDRELLGLYDGVPHTERTGLEGPDVVTLYRFALCEMCDDLDDLAEEVYVTIVHELAHAAGIDDDELDDLGWG